MTRGWWVAFVSWAAVVAATLLIPLPFVQLNPGPAFDVPPVVRFQGHPSNPVNGKLLATTVLLTRPHVPDLVQSLLGDDAHEILREREVVPAGVSREEYIRAERQIFNESARTGAAVGLRAAGLPVAAGGGGARVAAIIKNTPAVGHLRVGDVVTEADGKQVRLSADLVNATAGLPAGRTVNLTVVREGKPTRIPISLAPIGQLGRPGIGVDVVSVAPRIDLPFPVDVNVNDVGGPSAGLMIALSAYDLAAPADVVRGRVIAGTGTIDVNGNVGPVGGVAEKVAGAEQAGATVFLAPRGEAVQARRAASKGLRVVEVRTFDDAVRALEAP